MAILSLSIPILGLFCAGMVALQIVRNVLSWRGLSRGMRERDKHLVRLMNNNRILPIAVEWLLFWGSWVGMFLYYR